MSTAQADLTTTVDPDLIAMMDAVFADQRANQSPDAPVDLDRRLWSNLDELGLVRLTGSEEAGGSGAGWPEAAALLTAAARHAVRIPLAEHDLLGCWLLEAADLPVGGAVRTACVLDADGTANGVPWASTVDSIVAVWPSGGAYRIAELDATAPSVRITAGANMIGEARDAVAVDVTALTGDEVPSATVAELRLKSALVRAIQVCAALDRVVELAVDHTTSRIQFGRPLAKFQAVQNLIADAAAEAALARAATEAALVAAVTGGWSAPRLEFLVAAARSCAGHATSVVVRNAHQALGAIGTTHEHRLHQYTRPALAWRSEFGSVDYWDGQVADAALRAGGTGLWSLITG